MMDKSGQKKMQNDPRRTEGNGGNRTTARADRFWQEQQARSAARTPDETGRGSARPASDARAEQVEIGDGAFAPSSRASDRAFAPSSGMSGSAKKAPVPELSGAARAEAGVGSRGIEIAGAKAASKSKQPDFGEPSAARAGASASARSADDAGELDAALPGAFRVRPSLHADPGLSVATFDPTNPLPDEAATEGNSARRSDVFAHDGGTPLVAARVVSSATGLGQSEEGGDVVVATAEKDSAWRLFRRNRRAQLLLASMLAVVVGLAVGLTVALTKGPEAATVTGSQAEDFWDGLQVPPDLDGTELRARFGACVAMNGDGTRVAIASPGVFDSTGDSDGLVRRGLVTVFDRTDNGWKLQQEIRTKARDEQSTLFEPMSEVWNELIVALSRDGNKLAVGSPFHDAPNGTNIGQVEAFVLKEGVWEPAGVPLNGSEGGDYFGASVSLSKDGGWMAIGAPGGSKNEEHSGAASVYFFNDDAWKLLGAGDIAGVAAGQRLGGSVSLSSDGFTLAVGSSAISGSGNTKVANVYKFRAGDWNELGSGIEGGVGLFDTAYCVAISADGERVVLSNHYTVGQVRDDLDDFKDNIDLFVQAFQFESGDVQDWVPLGKNLHAKSPGEKSGYFVSLSDDGDVIVMGDPGRAVESGGNTGHAHLFVYDPNKGNFRQMGPDVNGEDAGDLFGFDVVISGDGRYFAAGAPTNRGTGFEYGRMKVFNVPEGI